MYHPSPSTSNPQYAVPSPSVVVSPSPPPFAASSGQSEVLSSSGIVRTLDPQLVINPNLSPAHGRSAASTAARPSVDVHPGSYTSLPAIDAFPPPLLDHHHLLYSDHAATAARDLSSRLQPPPPAASPPQRRAAAEDVSFAPATPVFAHAPAIDSSSSELASAASAAPLPASASASSSLPSHSSSSPPAVDAAPPSSSSSGSIPSSSAVPVLLSSPSSSIHRSSSLLHLRGTNKKLVLGMVGLPARGKCFAAGTGLRTMDGDVRRVEELRGGELLMGDDGQPRVVTPGSLHRGRGEMFCVKPAGCSGRAAPFTVNAAHILVLVSCERPRIVQQRQQQTTAACSSCWTLLWLEVSGGRALREVRLQFHSRAAAEAELALRLLKWRPVEWEVTVRDFLKAPARLRRLFRLFRPGAVTFTCTEQLSLQRALAGVLAAPPTAAQLAWAAWYIGLWLAVGVASEKWLCLPSEVASAPHCPIACRLLQYESLFDQRVCVEQQQQLSGPPVRLYKLGSVAAELLDAFALLQPQAAPVPSVWLRDTVEVRRRILAGVIDGGGRWLESGESTWVDGCCELSSRQRDALLLLKPLALSLGITSGPVVAAVKIDGGTGQRCPGFRLQLSAFAADATQYCAVLSRRRSRPPGREARCHPFSVVSCGRGDYYGFAVHGGANRRFLLEDFTVTHNVSAPS